MRSLERLAKEAARRNQRGLSLVDRSFPEQAKFVLDNAQFIAACCTRRAGKSNGLALKFFSKARKYPKIILPYIALTRDSAKNIMWPVFQEMDEKYKIGAEFLEASLTIKVPNGGMIKLFGADMKNFIRRLRGMKFPFAGVDEGQEFGSHLSSLIDDVLTPSIADFPDGQIALTGTPGAIPHGYFFEVTEQGKYGYSVHHWSLYQNPYMPTARKFVSDLKAKKGWTDENPTYQREWLGKWVEDYDVLVYKFKRSKNLYKELPQGHAWARILAIDYGWNDQTAFSVVAYSLTHRQVYVEHVEGHSSMIPSKIADRIQELMTEFKPEKVIADTGGLGKSITEEFRQRYHIPIEAAEKTEKLTFINMMNGDFIDGKLWVNEKLVKLQEQYEALRKAENFKEDPTLPNDLADATLYAYRKAKHYLGEEPEPVAPVGTAEWGKREAERMLAEDMEAFEEEKSKPWWEN